MNDISLISQAGEIDLELSDVGLLLDDSLRFAILLSLFTDGRADDDEADPSDQRGYWGDELDDDQIRLGSKLWLLGREKRSNEVLARAEQYTEDALRWLVDDGHFEEISAAARYENNQLLLTIYPIGLSISL